MSPGVVVGEPALCCVILKLLIPWLLKRSISSLSKRFIKKNITPNKKMNGNISNTIEGIFKIVKIIGKYILLSLSSKYFKFPMYLIIFTPSFFKN